MNTIHTIGHSTVTIEAFVEHLKYHKIDTVVDVRSTPYSRFANQFNKEILAATLKNKGILYIYLGDTLGARHTKSTLLFEDGKVDFSKVAVSDNFVGGMSRVEDGVRKEYKITLMCSEKNPIECHRFSLLSCYLSEKGYPIKHLVGEKIFDHKLLVSKLLEYYKKFNRITTDFDKIVNFENLQRSLFEVDYIDESELYLKLNKLIGYNSSEAKEIE